MVTVLPVRAAAFSPARPHRSETGRITGLREAVSRLRNAMRHRREVHRLRLLDDRLLHDIGLIRADVDAALDLPLDRDPSLHLMEVSGRSRRSL